MAETRSDWLRIERAVERVDYRLQHLPRRSRIAVRRELRENVRLASVDVGSRLAVQQLGDLGHPGGRLPHRGVRGGDAPASLSAAAMWVALVEGAALILSYAATAAFAAGARATNPHLTGTLHWSGVHYLVGDATFTFIDGRSNSVGGAWTPAVYVLMSGGAVIAGDCGG